jgi:hypothetical protein
VFKEDIMGEVMITKIKSIYGEIVGYIESIDVKPGSTPFILTKSCADNYNSSVDELTGISGSDYSKFRIPSHDIRTVMNYRAFLWPASGLAKKLEAEYGFGSITKSNPVIVVNNDNSNKVTVSSTFTLTQMIEHQESEEIKSKLIELDSELSQKEQNWEKIKSILAWILNTSKDIFIQVLPTILKQVSQ